MKKVMTTLGAIIIASAMLLSCSQKPTEIKLSDLNTACDYVDAIEKCFDALIELKGENENFDDLPEDQQDQVFSVAHKYTIEMKEHQEEIRVEMAKQLSLEKANVTSLEQAQRDQNALENKKNQDNNDNLEDVYNF
jgi:hypothetical protein